MTVRDLVGATLRRRAELTRLLAWALLGALPTFVGGLAIARAVDDGFLAGRTSTGLTWLAVLAAAVPIGAVGSRQTYLGVARMVEPLRDQMVRTVVHGALRRSTSPEAVVDETGAVARLTQHVETVRDTVAGVLLLVLGFVAALVAALAGLAALAPIVLPLVVAPLLLAIGGFVATLPTVTRQQRRLLLADEATAQLASSSIVGLRDVTACGGEEVVSARLDQRIDDQVSAGRAMAWMTALRTLIVALGAQLPVVLVLVLSGFLLRRGLSPGALLGTLTYLIQGLEPAVASIVSGVGAPVALLAETIRRLDEALPSKAAGPIPGPTRGAAPRRRHLQLREVTFRYRSAAEPVLTSLTLDISEGEHLAVVGPSGAGKSTLAALAVGVLRPQSGSITFGGHEAGEVVANRRVLIPQQAYVFRGSLEENLRYLRPAAARAHMDRAVAAVGLEALVSRLGGYGAWMEPGLLSSGERQLVALGRAHVAGPPLVVLDEATCHLDPAAEAVAEEAFAALGCTLVVIAHRISSAQRARRILLLDGPRFLVAPHEDLLQESPLYADLVGHWGR